MEYLDYRAKFIVQTINMMNTILDDADKQTPIEGIMLLELCTAQLHYGSANFEIFTQRKIDKYVADFFVQYNYHFLDRKPVKIIIECDGHDFHEKTKQQAAKDKSRDRFFTTAGYHVLRYTGSEIVKNTTNIHRDLNDLINTPD